MAKDGIYFEQSESQGRSSLRYFSFADRARTLLAMLEKPLHLGIAISPDERSLLYSQVDDRGSTQERVVIGSQEGAVRGRTRATSRAAHALEE